MNVWKAGTDVDTTIKSLIANHFPLLAGIDNKILVVFKEKASKVGDAVVQGKTAKANQLLGVVGEVEYKFVITLAQDEWQSLTDREREALLFHHLCACGAEEDQQTGDVKCFVKLPDVSFFREEVEQYGFWRTSGGPPPEPNLIDELFGVKPQATPAPGTSAAPANP